jgi:hypothetical protein
VSSLADVTQIAGMALRTVKAENAFKIDSLKEQEVGVAPAIRNKAGANKGWKKQAREREER